MVAIASRLEAIASRSEVIAFHVSPMISGGCLPSDLVPSTGQADVIFSAQIQRLRFYRRHRGRSKKVFIGDAVFGKEVMRRQIGPDR